MLKETTEQIASRLRRSNPRIPVDRAYRKAASLWRGLLFFAIGLACLGAGGVLLLKVVAATSTAPSIGLIVLCGIPIVGGIYCIFAGGNVVSGEAMDAAGESGGRVTRLVARAVRLARGKNGTP